MRGAASCQPRRFERCFGCVCVGAHLGHCLRVRENASSCTQVDTQPEALAPGCCLCKQFLRSPFRGGDYRRAWRSMCRATMHALAVPAVPEADPEADTATMHCGMQGNTDNSQQRQLKTRARAVCEPSRASTACHTRPFARAHTHTDVHNKTRRERARTHTCTTACTAWTNSGLLGSTALSMSGLSGICSSISFWPSPALSSPIVAVCPPAPCMRKTRRAGERVQRGGQRRRPGAGPRTRP